MTKVDVREYSDWLTPYFLRNTPGVIHSVFNRVLNIQVEPSHDQPSLISLCHAGVDPGAFAVILSGRVNFASLNVGQPVRLSPAGMQLSSSKDRFQFGIVNAAVYEHQPAWGEIQQLWQGRALSAARAELCRLVAAEKDKSLALSLVLETLSENHSTDLHALSDVPFSIEQVFIREALGVAMSECLNGIDSSSEGWLHAVDTVIGLGSGLTPTGDDFLAGFILGCHCYKDTGERWRSWLGFGRLHPLLQKTHVLSREFIRAAAQGGCSRTWQQLLAAGPGAQLSSFVTRILSFGSCSGADMLAGFIWALYCLDR